MAAEILDDTLKFFILASLWVVANLVMFLWFVGAQTHFMALLRARKASSVLSSPIESFRRQDDPALEAGRREGNRRHNVWTAWLVLTSLVAGVVGFLWW